MIEEMDCSQYLDPRQTFTSGLKKSDFDFPHQTAVGLATLSLRSIANSFAPFSEQARSFNHWISQRIALPMREGETAIERPWANSNMAAFWKEDTYKSRFLNLHSKANKTWKAYKHSVGLAISPTDTSSIDSPSANGFFPACPLHGCCDCHRWSCQQPRHASQASTHQKPDSKTTDSYTLKELSPSQPIGIKLEWPHHPIEKLFVLANQKGTIRRIQLLNLLELYLTKLCHEPFQQRITILKPSRW